MRLIDADELIESLKATYNHEKDVINSYWLLNTLIDKVDEVPTAYDVDKVVEQLEAEKNPFYREDGSLMCNRPNIRIDKAIEIVKVGGRGGN